MDKNEIFTKSELEYERLLNIITETSCKGKHDEELSKHEELTEIFENYKLKGSFCIDGKKYDYNVNIPYGNIRFETFCRVNPFIIITEQDRSFMIEQIDFQSEYDDDFARLNMKYLNKNKVCGNKTYDYNYFSGKTVGYSNFDDNELISILNALIKIDGLKACKNYNYRILKELYDVIYSSEPTKKDKLKREAKNLSCLETNKITTLLGDSFVRTGFKETTKERKV